MKKYNKYNKMIIWNYNNGNDIQGYDVDELEKDPDFIIQAMDAASDKNLYNLLSDEAKNDPEIVLHIIRRFKNDRDFVLKVATNYVANAEFSINNQDLIEVLIEIDNGRGEHVNMQLENINPCEMRLKAILSSIHTEVLEAANQLVNEEKTSNVTAFGYIEAVYSTNNVIKDYFAKTRIDELFGDYQKLERDLHHQFDEPDMIEKIGINNFIVSMLSIKDEYLSKYVSCNLENTASGLRDSINKIIYNWEDYEYDRDKGICEYIKNYYDKEFLELEIPEKEMLIRYIAEVVNRPGLVECSNDEKEELFQSLEESMDDEFLDYDVDSIDDIMYELKMKKLYKNKRNEDYDFEYGFEEFDYKKLSFKMKRKVDILVEDVKLLYEQDYEDSYTIINKENLTGKAKIIEFKPKKD